MEGVEKDLESDMELKEYIPGLPKIKISIDLVSIMACVASLCQRH